MNGWQITGLVVVVVLGFAWWKIRASRRKRQWSSRRAGGKNVTFAIEATR